eukprot:scaffold87103_cov48-Phaeocystis_antarctica.AAC.1
MCLLSACVHHLSARNCLSQLSPEDWTRSQAECVFSSFTRLRAVAGRMSETLLEAVRALRVADPDLGLKPLLVKLREQQPDLGAATREVREALMALKAESEASAPGARLAVTVGPGQSQTVAVGARSGQPVAVERDEYALFKAM